MDQQTYLDLITALNIIQDGRSAPAQRESAEKAVNLFGEVPNAISYIYYILATNNEQHTLFIRHFCLNTLKGIIISRWNRLTKDEKTYVKKLVCDYMNEVINGTTDANFVHTKFAEVYAELIKREWPQTWPSMYDDIKKSMRSSCTQFITGVRVFQYFLQDLNSEGADDRLTKERRSDLITAFNKIADDFIRFINFMIPQYAVDPSITEVLVTDCVRLYAAMVPPLNLDTLKRFLDSILSVLDAYSTNDVILPEILILLDNLATVNYHYDTRDLAIRVLQTLLAMYPAMTQKFPNMEADYSIYRAYYIAVIDFCVYQRNLLMQWTPREVEYYQKLQQLMISLLVYPRLEIADLAVDAIPSLFPDITRNDCKAIRVDAENGIHEVLNNLLTSIQNNNIRHPQFRMTHDAYDFDETEYLKDYQQYLEEIRHVIIALTRVYHVTIVKSILLILKTQYSENVLLLDALLQILNAFNRGITTHNINVKVKQELIGTGKDIVQQFLSFPVGTTYDQDSYTIRFIMSFLWVLQQDQQSLMGYIQMLIMMIQNASELYNGNVEQQLKLRATASNHLQLTIKAQGSTLIAQLEQLLPVVYQLATSATDAVTRNNLCVAFLALAMNVNNPKERETKMASVFKPIIDYLQAPNLTSAFASPVEFFTMFDSNLDKLAEVGNLLTCLNAMLDVIQTTNEYIVISESLFQVLGGSFASLLETASYLLVGTGADETQLSAWRWMTPTEVVGLECGNNSPLQSTRMTSIFVVITKLWRHMLNCENVATDQVIEALGTIIIRYTPFYRLYLLTNVVKNILTPLYLSCPSSWSQKKGEPSSTLVQLITTELAALQQRLNTGENPSCMMALNLQIPGASGPQAFEEASGIIQHHQLQSLSQSIISFFLAMAGYSLKGYKQTSAVRHFSSNLMNSVEDRYRNRASVSRVNSYIGGTSLSNAAKLADNEQVQQKSMEYFRRVFESIAVTNTDISRLIQQIILVFVNEGDAFEDFIIRSTLNFCSFYVAYLGGRTNHAQFLDTLFRVILTILMTQECDDSLQKRYIAISAYIFDFNIVKKNITPYRVSSKEPISSSIDQILGQTNLVTDSMLRGLKTKMTSCNSEIQSVDIMRDFFIELKTAFEGNGDTQAKANMMVDIPRTAIGRKNKKNKKNVGHNRNNAKGNDNQRGKGKKGKRHQYRNQNRDHSKIFGNDDDELEAMSQWQ